MRFVAPARAELDARVFDRPVFADFQRWRSWLDGVQWPAIDELDRAACELPSDPPMRFIEQTRALLADGLHYEQRIAAHGVIATRAASWHDLFNALVWLRFGVLKRALNRRQACDVARFGPARRSRAQAALTQFDESGAVLLLRDEARIDAWDRHDWVGLFAGLRQADYSLAVIGHALLEQALLPGRLLCGRALVVRSTDPAGERDAVLDAIAGRIADATLLDDPQQLRPLPLMGLPGWHARAGDPMFLREAPCFAARRAGRCYPPPLCASTLLLRSTSSSTSLKSTGLVR